MLENQIDSAFAAINETTAVEKPANLVSRMSFNRVFYPVTNTLETDSETQVSAAQSRLQTQETTLEHSNVHSMTNNTNENVPKSSKGLAGSTL